MSSLKNKKKLTTNICCLGVDGVGIPTCCVMANMCPTLKIAITDLMPDRISIWKGKKMPSQEPGLDEMLKKCQNKNLVFVSDTVGAIREADLIFISLSTPMQQHGSGGDVYYNPNLSNIEKAARLIAKVANSNKIIVEKSTSPVGNTEVLTRILKTAKNGGMKFRVLSNPEFYSAGKAIQSLLKPSRILIGSDLTSEGIAAAEVLASIYAHWVPKDRIITMSTWSLEMGKLSLNACLAQRLSSLTTMSMLCEAMGGDISEVVKMVGTCQEIGSEYLQPTFGFGGNLKKDLLCLIYMCERYKLTQAADYWRQVIELNEFHLKRFIQKILSTYFNTLTRKKIGIWGFAYKNGVDLTEDSPAIFICKSLLKEGAKLRIYDPKVEKRQIFEELRYACGDETPLKAVTVCEDPYNAAYKCHGIVCCTDWDEFKDLNFAVVYKEMMRPAYIFDGRKCLPHDDLITLGFIVKTIGKKFPEI